MPPATLSNTVQAALTAAAGQPNHVVVLPDRLPIAARRAVAQSMLKAGLVEEVAVGTGQAAWRTNEAGDPVALRATPAGLVATEDVGGTRTAAARVPGKPDLEPDAAPAPPSGRVRLREAAAAILTVWDADAERTGLANAVEALRSAVNASRSMAGAGKPPRGSRPGTKQQAVLALLRRPEGATVAQVAETTGWALPTVRGFFAALKKRGITVGVLERVRQIGSGKQGAKGSYTVYRIEEAG